DDDYLDYEDDSETEQSMDRKESFGSLGNQHENDTEQEDNLDDDDDDEDFVIRSKSRRSGNKRKGNSRAQGDYLSVPLSIGTEHNLGGAMATTCAESPDGELLSGSCAPLQTPNGSLALPPSPESPSQSKMLDSELSGLACEASAPVSL